MIYLSFDPVAFVVDSFAVRWYHVIYPASLLLGFVFVLLEARRLGIRFVHSVIIGMLAGIFIVAFTQLFYYAELWAYYGDLCSVKLVPTAGRLDGAIFGFFVLLLVYAPVTKLSFWKLSDMTALALAIGIAGIRVGCFVNGCCYGLASGLPWAVVYAHPESIAPQLVPLHPVQFYQVVWYLAVFIALWVLRKELRPEGSLYLLFIILHAAGDFVTRCFRDDYAVLFGLQSAQVLSIIMLLIAVPLYIIRARRRAPA